MRSQIEERPLAPSQRENTKKEKRGRKGKREITGRLDLVDPETLESFSLLNRIRLGGEIKGSRRNPFRPGQHHAPSARSAAAGINTGATANG